MYIHVSITDYEENPTLRHYKEKFCDDDVEYAFYCLLQKLIDLWSGVDVHELKLFCKWDFRLPHDLTTELNNVNNLEKAFDLLVKTPFCTWLEIRMLERMAKVAKIPEAKILIDMFKKYVHSRKCSEVELYFKKKYIDPDHVTLVTAKFNENAENLTVAELIDYCHRLETIIKLDESSAPMKYKKGCLEICFATSKIHYLLAFEIAKSNFFKFRFIHIQYLEVGTLPRIYTVNLSEAENAEFILKRISSISNCKILMYIYTYVHTYVCMYTIDHTHVKFCVSCVCFFMWSDRLHNQLNSCIPCTKNSINTLYAYVNFYLL